MPHDLNDDDVGAGKGLIPKSNNPSSEPMLTQTLVAIWRHQATIN